MNEKIKKILDGVPVDKDLFDELISENEMMVHWVQKNQDGTFEAEVRINLYSKKLGLCFSVVKLVTWKPKWDIDEW